MSLKLGYQKILVQFLVAILLFQFPFFRLAFHEDIMKASQHCNNFVFSLSPKPSIVSQLFLGFDLVFGLKCVLLACMFQVTGACIVILQLQEQHKSEFHFKRAFYKTIKRDSSKILAIRRVKKWDLVYEFILPKYPDNHMQLPVYQMAFFDCDLSVNQEEFPPSLDQKTPSMRPQLDQGLVFLQTRPYLQST
jgi:hypothetical protein